MTSYRHRCTQIEDQGPGLEARAARLHEGSGEHTRPGVSVDSTGKLASFFTIEGKQDRGPAILASIALPPDANALNSRSNVRE